MKPVYNLMREDIVAKFGIPVLYSKDCQYLALEIRRLAGRNISSTTIKRFFGLVKSSSKPSGYTLDTLAIYLGFGSFVEYSNCFGKDKLKGPAVDSWYLLKKRINILTSISLDSIKLKTNYDSDTFIRRKPLEEFLESFLGSDGIITALTAPDGYGKSAAVIQLSEYFFTGENAIYPQDILCLIDGNFFFSLVSRYPDISLLNNLMDFDFKNSLTHIFNDDMDSLKGRVVVIIDDFDEVFTDTERLHSFARNLMRMVMAYKDQKWYKILITLKPENLKYISFFTERNSALKWLWFGVDFGRKNLDSVNIPPVSKDELEQLLPEHEFEKLTAQLVTVLKYPYMLYTYLNLKRNQQPADEISVIGSYIRNIVFSGSGIPEKVSFIASFLEACWYGRRTDHVKKDILFKETNNSLVYDEFISCGLIIEITVYEKHLSYSTYCRFSNPGIFNFLLAEYWIGNGIVTIEVFNRVEVFYAKNMKRKSALHRYLWLHAIRDGNPDFLKRLHIHYKEKLEQGREEADAGPGQ